MYSCKRCGYDSKYKKCLIQHLNNKSECIYIIENLDRKVLLDELNKKYNEDAISCEFCEKKFNCKSSMYRHKNICKQKPIESNEQLFKMQQQINNQQSQIENLKKQPLNNDKINLELQYYKNRKNEKFFQLLLENYLGGTHKTLSCGVTDITTDTCHAEIKDWPSWKEAIGQLTCYNMVDPKETLNMYMFGKYTQKCKDEAMKIVTSCKINMYEFIETDDIISIMSLKNNEIIYNYKPI